MEFSDFDNTPTQSPRRREWLSDWVILAVVIVMLVITNIYGMRMQEGGRAVSSAESEAFQIGDFLARQAIVALGEGNISRAREVAHQAIEQYDALPWPAAYRRIEILREAILDKPGLSTLEKIASPQATEGLSRSQKQELAAEVRMWRDIYSGERLSSQQARQYVSKIGDLNLGPLNDIAAAEVYRKAGMDQQARETIARTVEEARRTVITLSTLLGLLVMLGMAGLFLLIRFLWLYGSELARAGAWPVSTPALLSAFLVYLIAYIFISLAIGSAADALTTGVSPEVETAISLGLQSIATLAAVAFAMARLRGVLGNWADSLWQVGLRWIGAGKSIVWGLGGYAAALPALLSTALIWRILSESLFKDVTTPEHPLVPQISEGGIAFAVAVVLAAIVAPVVEETAFRGMLYGALRGRVGVWVSAIVSGAIFALVHPTLPGQFLPILALGVVLAMLREKTGSLVPGIICHSLNNAAALIQVLLRL